MASLAGFHPSVSHFCAHFDAGCDFFSRIFLRLLPFLHFCVRFDPLCDFFPRIFFRIFAVFAFLRARAAKSCRKRVGLRSFRAVCVEKFAEFFSVFAFFRLFSASFRRLLPIDIVPQSLPESVHGLLLSLLAFRKKSYLI